MLDHPTCERLAQLRLFGMVHALTEQAHTPDLQALTFEGGVLNVDIKIHSPLIMRSLIGYISISGALPVTPNRASASCAQAAVGPVGISQDNRLNRSR